MGFPTPPTGSVVTSSTAPAAGMKILLNALYDFSFSRSQPDNFFYETTQSGVLWFTGSGNPTGGIDPGDYILFITESTYIWLLNKYPSTSSLFPTISINYCTGAYGPPTMSLSGSGFTGSGCLEFTGGL